MTVRRLLPSGAPAPASAAPAVAAVLLAAVLLAGCGLFSRPEIEYYSLDPDAPAVPVSAPPPLASAPPPLASAPPGALAVRPAGVPLGLAAVELPPGLDRREIVVRQDDGRLEVRGTELWAAPLGTMVLHALGFALADRLPEGMVVLPGQTRPAGGVRNLDVVFEDLAAGPERVVVLDAHWTLGATGAGRLAGREQIAEPVDSLGSADVAAGTSRALARLADRIAAAAGRPLPPPPPETGSPDLQPPEPEVLDLLPPPPP